MSVELKQNVKSSGVGVKTSPLVSVIIPCFNSARTLAQAIDSALAQTYPQIEVIVIDDGSTDGSAEICHTYADRIRVVAQQNSGLSAARNSGVTAATGAYVTLLDADDVLLSECVQRRVEILETDEGIGLVAGWFREIDAEGRPIDRIPEQRSVWSEQPFRQAIRRNWGPPVGWTFRRDAYFHVGGFDSELRSCEDWDFVIRIARVYRIGYDSTSQVLYRKSAGQMSSHHHVMLDACERVHQKNRANAINPFSYWLDVRFGRFELGRRTIYQVLFQERQNRLRTLIGLLVQHPYLAWVFCLSGISYVFGKRASSGRQSSDQS